MVIPTKLFLGRGLTSTAENVLCFVMPLPTVNFDFFVTVKAIFSLTVFVFHFISVHGCFDGSIQV